MNEGKLIISVDNIEGYVTAQQDITEGADVFWRAYVLYPVINVDKDHVALITELDSVGNGRIVKRDEFNTVIDETIANFVKAKKVNEIAGFSA